jgi:predicted HicB family RNase H-like nuclease
VPTAHFRISEELLERAQRAADADRRSLSNWLGLVVERALDEAEPEPAKESAS